MYNLQLLLSSKAAWSSSPELQLIFGLKKICNGWSYRGISLSDTNSGLFAGMVAFHGDYVPTEQGCCLRIAGSNDNLFFTGKLIN